MFEWFSQRKAVKQAIKLTRQRIEIDNKLNTLREYLKACLVNTPDKFISTGNGNVLLKTNYKRTLDTHKLYELLRKDDVLLAKFLDEMSIIKQGTLEKYIGTPAYEKLIAKVETSESVVINVK